MTMVYGDTRMNIVDKQRTTTVVMITVRTMAMATTMLLIIIKSDKLWDSKDLMTTTNFMNGTGLRI